MRLHIHLPFDSSAAYGASWANAVDATTSEISTIRKRALKKKLTLCKFNDTGSRGGFFFFFGFMRHGFHSVCKQVNIALYKQSSNTSSLLCYFGSVACYRHMFLQRRQRQQANLLFWQPISHNHT